MRKSSVRILIYLYAYFVGWIFSSADSTDAGKRYKGTSGQTPPHYEVVIPNRITETGEFITHTIPHHFKRSYYENRPKESMGPEDTVHYMVPIYGEKHHLELSPNNDVIGPGMVVEIHDGKKISDRKIRKLDNTQCHYKGNIKGQKNSKVALSTCYGLSGYIRTNDGDFIIEPVEGHDALSGKEHEHILYAHETDTPLSEVNCETKGDLAKILARRAARMNENTRDEDSNKPSNISEYHIEAMVVIDKTMLDRHKDIDVENYVLTVFNMAHALYHDASLGININLAIVRLIRLEEEENKLNLAVNKNARKTLEFFQDWQHKINPGDDTHPNHHDLAILLTRIDICGDENNCGILGASVIGGICDPKHQAILCEDVGLRLGFVIAHEIGHTLAIPHDGKESGCNIHPPNGLSTVMNPSVNIRTTEWSSCSRKYLSMFIEQGYGKCLLDPPTDHSFEMPDILPGVMYGGDFQCKELLAPSATLCDVGIECDNLICFIEDKGCIETHTSAAAGTNCGEKKWCFSGKCLEAGERPGATDGCWSSWSRWSGCSRTCGAGISTQERHCDKPPPSHGGKYCSGEHRRHKICNTQPCEIGAPSFRNVQCSEFNEWVYPEDNQVHQWRAIHMANENPCILFCVNDQGDIASLRPRVEDGTKCVRGLRDICIDGICREIPCDLNLESKAVEDWCGVCKGDGTSCTVKSNQTRFLVNKKLPNSKYFVNHNHKNSVVLGQENLVYIPSGSVNIKIEETLPSDSVIQVRDCSSNSTLLEGDVPGVYNISGSKAWFGNIRTKQEALSIPGTISKDISIWVIVSGDVTIKYSYGIPCAKGRVTVFDWDYLEWSRCSAQCGPGTEVAVPKCKEKVSGLVDDRYCKSKNKPAERVRPCEIAPCVPRWMIGDWQECGNCPHGKRVRLVKCVIPTGEGEGESDVIPDYRCAPPKPKEKEKCSCDSHKKYVKRGNTQSVAQQEAKFPQADDDLPTTSNPAELHSSANLESVINANHLKITVDKENPKDVNLTIHNDNQQPPSSCQSSNKSNAINLSNKEAMKYIDKLSKGLGTNKPKV